VSAIKKKILNAARDAARDFACYDRKEDEDLSADALDEAVRTGAVTIDEIVAAFRKDLIKWARLGQ
jgi:hypothetical protein